MKTKEDKYRELIHLLRGNRPTLEEKENFTDKIMQSIKPVNRKESFIEKVTSFLFSWVNIYWLRGAMSIFAVIFAGIFISQQVIIARRLNNLENQYINTDTKGFYPQPELDIMKTVLVNKLLSSEDSITVSRSDLEELLNSYIDMKKDEEVSNNKISIEQRMQQKFRQYSEKKLTEEEL